MNNCNRTDINDGTSVEEIIENIQEMLYNLSLYIDEIERVNPDGIYGMETEESVKSFQRYVDLDADGRVDYVTFTKLCEVYDDELDKRREPKKAAHFHRTLKDDRISGGDTHSLVMIIQIMLNTIALMYEFTELDVTGNYDEPTINTVKHFQRVNGLPESGEADRETWDRLADAYEKYADSE